MTSKDYNLIHDLKEKVRENDSLKLLNDELKSQLSEIHEILKFKEKELNKLIFDRESLSKKQEEFTKFIEETKLKEESYKREIQDLKKINENLENSKNQLSKALSEARFSIENLQKALKSKESSIAKLNTRYNSLERELDSITSPKFRPEPSRIDFNRLKIPERIGTSSSPERFEYNFTERDEDLTYKAVCHEAMQIIGVTSSKDLASKLVHLRQTHSKYKKAKKIIDRISDMIVQCSPEGLFKKEPSIRQIWKWITRLLEEYMKIKQSVTGEGYIKLCDLLQAQTIEEVLKRVKDLKKRAESLY